MGSAIGNALCCCGGVIGNCIGEKYGEEAVKKFGLQKKAGKVNCRLRSGENSRVPRF